MLRRLVDMVRQWPGVATSILKSAFYLVVLVPAQDFASGSFRAHLASSGAVLWNNMWFSGHPLPSYGLVSAHLEGWFGVRLVAGMSTVAATWGFSLLVRRTRANFVGSVNVSSVVFALCVGANMWAGRLTFVPSIAFGVLCLLALSYRKALWSVLAASACALSSPVGAVFLLVILAALWLAEWSRPRVLVAGFAAAVPLVVTVSLFSEGGWFPFRWQSLLLVFVAIAVVLVACCRHAVIRHAALLYAVLVLAAFVVRTPLGGNVARLSWLAAIPVALLCVPRDRRFMAASFVIFAVCWNSVYLPFGRPLNTESMQSRFYEPVTEFILSQPGVHKVEVVPTNTRRESDFVARVVPLARGWQTQIDRDRNGIFYSQTLTAREYREWLDRNAVSYVAVPARDVHDIGREEASLVATMSDDLHTVYRDDDWTIYEVQSARPLASNDVSVTSVSPEQIRLTASRSGRSVVRFRYTPMYEVTSGDACVSEDDDGWIRLDVGSPGDIVVTIKLTVAGLLRHRDQCG